MSTLSGEYVVTYTVTDNNGLFTTITETVTVESDVTAPAVPAITTSPATVGASPITIDGGSTEAGATIDTIQWSNISWYSNCRWFREFLISKNCTSLKVPTHSLQQRLMESNTSGRIITCSHYT